MGLAVYNSVILELRFPPICYRKLLSPAVVPFDNPQAAVGITASSLEDFKQVFPVRIYRTSQLDLPKCTFE